MKTAICCVCGTTKMKMVRTNDLDGYGSCIVIEVIATEEDPTWNEILSVWCPECGIMFNSDV